MLPILISVSVTPGPYCFCAYAGAVQNTIPANSGSHHAGRLNSFMQSLSGTEFTLLFTAVTTSLRVIGGKFAAEGLATLPHLEHDVVLARVLDHLYAEIVFRPHFGRWRMINLKGLDLLFEIGGVSANVDHIANA